MIYLVLYRLVLAALSLVNHFGVKVLFNADSVLLLRDY